MSKKGLPFQRDLFEATNQDEQLLYDLIINLNSKVRSAYNLINILSMLKPNKRLVYCVYAMIQAFKVTSNNGWYKLPLDFSHEQLGEMIGVHRVTVCRIINHWREINLLDIIDNKMYVHDSLFLKAQELIKN